MKELKIEIASPPDREELVAEIWQDNQMIAEVNQENNELVIQIYFENNFIEVNYNSFLLALLAAKDKLQGI
ncbi:hypothetical protein ACE193_24085 [Bernardetia sp. OM2101]|uniref:hypothetical protein n=1 Tax=Bernardetia sp. OM2101 TaxID=3344876 RepID=UPI0035CF911A